MNDGVDVVGLHMVVPLCSTTAPIGTVASGATSVVSTP